MRSALCRLKFLHSQAHSFYGSIIKPCVTFMKVARLQEQLQAERDLRAALEVGLSMSSGQLSGSRAMDSKVVGMI